MTTSEKLLIIVMVLLTIFVFEFLLRVEKENIINYIRIKKLEKMIRMDKNDYQKIFTLLEKVELTDQNNILRFRVSYLKTFKNEYRQYTFGNESEEPFVSLMDMKRCNTVEELKKIIDDAKTTPYIEYIPRSLF